MTDVPDVRLWTVWNRPDPTESVLFLVNSGIDPDKFFPVIGNWIVFDGIGRGEVERRISKFARLASSGQWTRIRDLLREYHTPDPSDWSGSGVPGMGGGYYGSVSDSIDRLFDDLSNSFPKKPAAYSTFALDPTDYAIETEKINPNPRRNPEVDLSLELDPVAQILTTGIRRGYAKLFSGAQELFRKATAKKRLRVEGLSDKIPNPEYESLSLKVAVITQRMKELASGLKGGDLFPTTSPAETGVYPKKHEDVVQREGVFETVAWWPRSMQKERTDRWKYMFYRRTLAWASTSLQRLDDLLMRQGWYDRTNPSNPDAIGADVRANALARYYEVVVGPTISRAKEIVSEEMDLITMDFTREERMGVLFEYMDLKMEDLRYETSKSTDEYRRERENQLERALYDFAHGEMLRDYDTWLSIRKATDKTRKEFEITVKPTLVDAVSRTILNKVGFGGIGFVPPSKDSSVTDIYDGYLESYALKLSDAEISSINGTLIETFYLIVLDGANSHNVEINKVTTGLSLTGQERIYYDDYEKNTNIDNKLYRMLVTIMAFPSDAYSATFEKLTNDPEYVDSLRLVLLYPSGFQRPNTIVPSIRTHVNDVVFGTFYRKKMTTGLINVDAMSKNRGDLGALDLFETWIRNYARPGTRLPEPTMEILKLNDAYELSRLTVALRREFETKDVDSEVEIDVYDNQKISLKYNEDCRKNLEVWIREYPSNATTARFRWFRNGIPLRGYEEGERVIGRSSRDPNPKISSRVEVGPNFPGGAYYCEVTVLRTGPGLLPLVLAQGISSTRTRRITASCARCEGSERYDVEEEPHLEGSEKACSWTVPRTLLTKRDLEVRHFGLDWLVDTMISEFALYRDVLLERGKPIDLTNMVEKEGLISRVESMRRLADLLSEEGDRGGGAIIWNRTAREENRKLVSTADPSLIRTPNARTKLLRDLSYGTLLILLKDFYGTLSDLYGSDSDPVHSLYSPRSRLHDAMGPIYIPIAKRTEVRNSIAVVDRLMDSYGNFDFSRKQRADHENRPPPRFEHTISESIVRVPRKGNERRSTNDGYVAPYDRSRSLYHPESRYDYRDDPSRTPSESVHEMRTEKGEAKEELFFDLVGWEETQKTYQIRGNGRINFEGKHHHTEKTPDLYSLITRAPHLVPGAGGAWLAPDPSSSDVGYVVVIPETEEETNTTEIYVLTFFIFELRSTAAGGRLSIRRDWDYYLVEGSVREESRDDLEYLKREISERDRLLRDEIQLSLDTNQTGTDETNVHFAKIFSHFGFLREHIRNYNRILTQ